MYKYSLPHVPLEFNTIPRVFKYIENYAHNNAIDPGEEDLKQSFNDYYEKRPVIIRKLNKSKDYIAKLKVKNENHSYIRREIEKNKNFLIRMNCYLPLMAENIEEYTYLNLNKEDHAKLYTEHRLLVKIVDKIIPFYSIESLGFVEPASNKKIKRCKDLIERCKNELAIPRCSIKKLYFEGEILNLKNRIEMEIEDGFLNYSPKQYMDMALRLKNRSKCSFSLLRGVIKYHLGQQLSTFRSKKLENKLTKTKKYKIWNWRRHNQKGNQTQCAKEISISRSTVNKHWKYSPESV